MIVTCESCKSRYKLDDSKIVGRGAKITCPKCKNVFVVYAKTEDAAKPEPGPKAEPPRAAGTPPPDPSAVGREAPRAAEPGRVVGPSATAGGGPRVAAARPDTPPPSTWDDEEPTRIGDSLDEPSHEVQRPGGKPVPRGASAPAPAPSAPAPVAPPPAASAAEIAARAASLDFRKVGVTTWKVKVKIGLVYDFSDIKTLRKYIQDGRVTPADVVSWDGKSWRAIGEIPDLDVFFVETWEMLAARKEEGGAAPPAPPAEASKPPSDEPTRVPAAAEASPYKDPFAEHRKKQQEQRKAPPAATPAPTPPAPTPASRTPMLVGVVVLLLLVAAGVWWMQQAPSGGDARPVTPTQAPPAAGSAEDIRNRLNEDLKRSIEGNPAPDAGTAETAPKPPEGGEVRPIPPDATARPPGVPEGATPIKRPGTAPSTPGIAVGDTTASDHEAAGDDAASSGDWSTAVTAYKKAVALDGKSAKLALKLGSAQYEAGDYGGAQPTLERAAKLGSKDAYKYLGHVARVQGDVPGATYQYQQYLKGSPRDAAEIEKVIAQMSGG